jgi:hypothetical protein
MHSKVIMNKNIKIIYRIWGYGDMIYDDDEPYSKWWETVKENAQLLHRECNREKSNQVSNNRKINLFQTFHFS